MKLHDAIKQLEENAEVIDRINLNHYEIKGIACNSENVKEDDLFIAIKGFKSDGHDYIKQAINNGACAVIGEDRIDSLSVPYIQVKNSRRAVGLVSNVFYASPWKEKLLIGVTGTNGKTTTSYLVKEIMEYAGKSCALIGSVQNIVNGKVYKSSNTTPNSLEIHQLLTESDDDVVIIEVSSHALIQHRIEGIAFDYAIFTNLTHDHLDYHDSMEEYFQAKKRLFDHMKPTGKAVINVDDPWGEQLHNLLTKEGKTTVTVGERESVDFQIESYQLNPPVLHMRYKRKDSKLKPSMFGIHNMYNMAVAFSVALEEGIDEENTSAAIEAFEGVNGRFNMTQKDGVTFVVDYAHTPDALYHCLKTAKDCGAKRIFHIFGFRGDRDPSKRREMISISSEWSDRYFLTFDDLNTVSAQAMEEELTRLQQRFGREHGEVVADRTLAIKAASELAEEGDWVLITGKGNEAYQQTYELSSRSDSETIRLLTCGSKL